MTSVTATAGYGGPLVEKMANNCNGRREDDVNDQPRHTIIVNIVIFVILFFTYYNCEIYNLARCSLNILFPPIETI